MAETLFFDSILIIFGFFLIFYIVSTYNGLIQLKNNNHKAWANIDVVLKQRSDLIPNLVETVKGYAKYEKNVLEEITKLRTDMMNEVQISKKANISESISANLRSIFAIAENYPKLQASNSFLELQKQLAIMENQIADRREFYNDSILLYNTRIKSFPDTIMAMIFGMKEEEYFKASEEDKKETEVKI